MAIDPNMLITGAMASASWVLVWCTICLVRSQNKAGEKTARSQKKAAKKTASIQLFSEVWNRYQSFEMRLVRRDFARSMLDKDTSKPLDETLLLYFETLAFLTRRRILDRRMVLNTFIYEVKVYWFAAKPWIIQLRTRFDDPTIYEEMEWLNGIIVRLDAQKRHKTEAEVQLTPDMMDIFLRTEANVPASYESTPNQRMHTAALASTSRHIVRPTRWFHPATSLNMGMARRPRGR